jgi:nucleotide-binding universal stress UspA family protein
MKLHRILVATRGTAEDDESVRLACELAKKPKAEIYIIYVIEVSRNLPLDAVVEADIEKAEKILTQVEKIASENKYEVQTNIIQSREAGPAIIDEARDKKADLIIMGLPYKKRYGAFDLGKTVPYVLEEAPCRVILLREPFNREEK